LPVGGLIVAAVLLIVIRRGTRPADPAGGWAVAMPAQPLAQAAVLPSNQTPAVWMPEPQAPLTWRPAD
jgi:hypothetical protein